MNRDRSLRLVAITVLMLAGVLAGTQFGKIAPLVDWYRTESGFSLVLIGWLTSTIGIFVALVALPAGWAIELLGMRRTFVAASILLALGGVALALFTSPEAILAARVLEGAGYLVLVIAIPAIAAAVAPPEWRAPVLAVWGGFVPVGFALADFLAGWVLPAAGPQIYLLAAAMLFALLALVSAALLARVPDFPDMDAKPAAGQARGSFAATINTDVALVALAFGVYVVLSVGFFSFMPAFVGSGNSAVVLSAGTVALLVPLGNLATTVLVRGSDARFAAALPFAGFVVSAVAAFPTFGSGSATLATAAAVAVALAGGVTASALFASVPFIVPRAGSASVAIGLIAQAGGIATVFGPPLAGHVIDGQGWDGFGWFLTGAGVVGALCLVPLLARRSERGLAV